MSLRIDQTRPLNGVSLSATGHASAVSTILARVPGSFTMRSPSTAAGRIPPSPSVSLMLPDHPTRLRQAEAWAQPAPGRVPMVSGPLRIGRCIALHPSVATGVVTMPPKALRPAQHTHRTRHRTAHHHPRPPRPKAPGAAPRPPLRMTAFITEPALRIDVGGERVMREQLQHLLVLAELPNVHLVVIPFGSAAVAILGSGFTKFDYPDEEPSVIINAGAAGPFPATDEPSHIRRGQPLIDRLMGAGLAPGESVAMIRQYVTKWSGREF
ncbi:Scr1 family TA system antitoxin-like transcriptional regulator [Embleya sp. NPDC050493]|uniref:DUF5753 domain-containing protein n=1 Tax=Embleya sp. NPDC050493 TaxID=3363989 RepID=UPI00379694BF